MFVVYETLKRNIAPFFFSCRRKKQSHQSVSASGKSKKKKPADSKCTASLSIISEYQCKRLSLGKYPLCFYSEGLTLKPVHTH